MSADVDSRLLFAKDLAVEAGEKALAYFREIGSLVIESKGVQDMVSNADRDVETFVRQRIGKAFPGDGIVGEEYENVASSSGYTWVIDPIDGTANFVRGIPAWTVVLACVHDDRTRIGVIYEPSNNELFWGAEGRGAHLNNEVMSVAETSGINDGSLGVGMNNRTTGELIVRFIDNLIQRGGIFYRNASGALMLAYVASGRLIGYAEPHMNAWDCLAGQLLISEAGGVIEKQSADRMLEAGGRVIASAPPVFDSLVEMAQASTWQKN